MYICTTSMSRYLHVLSISLFCRPILPLAYYMIDYTEPHGFFRCHKVISLQSLLETLPRNSELLVRALAMRSVNVRQGRSDPQDLFGVKGDI